MAKQMVFAVSILCTQSEMSRSKDWLLEIWILCPSGAICLSADWCYRELALSKSNKACWSDTNRTSSSSHRNATCSRYVMAEIFITWR